MLINTRRLVEPFAHDDVVDASLAERRDHTHALQSIVYLGQVACKAPTLYAFTWPNHAHCPFSKKLEEDLAANKIFGPVAEDAWDDFVALRESFLAEVWRGLEADRYVNRLPPHQTFLSHFAMVHYMLDSHGMRVEDVHETFVQELQEIAPAEFSLILNRLQFVPAIKRRERMEM